jgi:WD40 repeat protein
LEGGDDMGFIQEGSSVDDRFRAEFSSDGTRVALGGDRVVKIWDAENGYSNSEIASHHFTEIAAIGNGISIWSPCQDRSGIRRSHAIVYAHSILVQADDQLYFRSTLPSSSNNSGRYARVWDVHTCRLIKDVALYNVRGYKQRRSVFTWRQTDCSYVLIYQTMGFRNLNSSI